MHLIDKGAGPNLVNDVYSPLLWEKQIQKLWTPRFQEATKQAISVVGFVPLVVHMGDLQVCRRLGAVENLAVDVLSRMI